MCRCTVKIVGIREIQVDGVDAVEMLILCDDAQVAPTEDDQKGISDNCKWRPITVKAESKDASGMKLSKSFKDGPRNMKLAQTPPEEIEALEKKPTKEPK